MSADCTLGSMFVVESCRGVYQLYVRIMNRWCPIGEMSKPCLNWDAVTVIYEKESL